DTTFSASLTDGTATGGGVDYTSTLTNASFSNGVTISGGTITVPAGVTSFTVTVPTTSDTIDEANETYTLTVGTKSGTGTINDDDNAPTISGVSSNSATEASDIVHTVTLSNASYQDTTFSASLTDGTATGGGVDYTSTLTNASFSNGVTISGGTITVPAGVTSFTVTVPTTADTIDEANETYTLTVGTKSGTGTINDDDGAPTISGVSDNSATEASDIVHTVTLSNASASDVTYALSFTNGTADASDYTSTLTNAAFSDGVTVSGGIITVPAGVTSFTITVPTTADSIDEADETYTITVGGASGTGTILDDDGAPSFSISGGSVSEGGQVTFTVTRTGDAQADQTVDYSTATGTAGSSDFTAASGTLTFSQGDTTKTFTVQTTDDALFESSESFTATLANASSGTISTPTATGTIVDNDAAAEFSISNASIAEGGVLTFTVTRSSDSQDAQTVNYATQTGTASLADFTAKSGTLTFAQGELTKTVTVQTTADSIFEGNESMTVVLSDATGGATVSASGGTGKGTITEGTPPPLTVSDVIVNEASPTAVFTVHGQQGQVVSLALSDASATGGGVDYGATGATKLQVSLNGGTTWTNYNSPVTLPAGGTILVRTPIVEDLISDNNEQFRLRATPNVGAGATGTGTIRDNGSGTVYGPDGDPDPDAPRTDDRPVTVTDVDVNEGSPTAVFTVTGSPGQHITLELDGGTASPGGTDFGSGGSNNLQISRDGGLTWTNYTPGGIDLPLSGSVLVRTEITDDGIQDNNEQFTLVATPQGGIANTGDAVIHDDGTGTVFGPDGSPDPTAIPTDDRPVTVSDPVVNESSPTAVFTVTGTAGQVVTLALGGESATPGGTDFGSDGPSNLQVSLDGGATWSDYTGPVTLPDGGTILVRTPIHEDGFSDNNEQFDLTATPRGGVTGAGTGTIHDDGTGTVYGPDGQPDPTAIPTDDRPVTVSDPVVNEHSPTAVFTVQGSEGQLVTLGLDGGTASSDGTDFGSDNPDNLQVSLDGGLTWTDYTGPVTLPPGGAILVRTPITEDGISDNDEHFTLIATPRGGVAGDGIGTIRDDGTGTVYGPDGQPDPDALRTDDRPVDVSDPVVNEGSPTAVFTVTGSEGQHLTLQLTGGSASAGGTDFGSSGPNNLQVSVDGGLTWTDYTGDVVVPPGGVVLVRTPISDDGIQDNNEQFALVATPLGGFAGTGTASIHDDGTGTIFGPNGQPDPTAIPTDDRPVTVSDPVVNEASPYAVFTVTGSGGQNITLDLSAETASPGGTDYGAPGSANLQVSTDGGHTWTDYSGHVTLPANGTILVRTPITEDHIRDNGEEFQLTATPIGGVRGTGTATIHDDGTGTVFRPDGTPDPTAQRSDDTPRPTNPEAPPPAPPVPAQVLAGPPPAAPLPPQVFDSVLRAGYVSGSGGDMFATTLTFDSTDTFRALLGIPGDLDDIYTRASGFRTMVAQSSDGALRLFRGVEDQILPLERVMHFQVPADAFLHNDPNETVRLTATLLDGSPLPEWLVFDGNAGTFEGHPPPGIQVDLRIKVTARDSQGREAVAMFRIRSDSSGKGLSSRLISGAAIRATPFALARDPRADGLTMSLRR
ncbi:MAG TPA: Calx-beta domain-containing protein, partial [Ramlibacter sp.]|uniref:Calx-beta domain-containing protein n=1 Tax=Ramlibacter sp. TaxID=1917967 RepID=UPI002CD98157